MVVLIQLDQSKDIRLDIFITKKKRTNLGLNERIYKDRSNRWLAR